MSHTRPVALLVLSVLLAGCSGASGAWPSLARRPGEAVPLAAAAPPVATTEAASAGAAPATAPSTPAVIAGRVAEAAAEIDRVAARLAVAQRNADATAGAARGAAPGSEAAAAAQLELSRLERVGAQLRDLRDRLDRIAGDAALAAADGNALPDRIAALGRLIRRVEALHADFDRGYDAARARLRS